MLSKIKTIKILTKFKKHNFKVYLHYKLVILNLLKNKILKIIKIHLNCKFVLKRLKRVTKTNLKQNIKHCILIEINLLLSKLWNQA